MKDLTITTFRGYTQVTGETTLTQVMDDIRTGKYIRSIQKIERLMAEGNEKEANRVKGQLPYLTATANYAERRLPNSLLRYNHVITLDIDNLPPAQVGPIRQLIKNAPHTLGLFLSPRRHGFKFFVYLCTEYAERLRQSSFAAAQQVTVAALERHHALMYDACREYYEQLLGVEIDTSGKDIGRGFFVSFDVEAYLNRELLEKVEEACCEIELVNQDAVHNAAPLDRANDNSPLQVFNNAVPQQQSEDNEFHNTVPQHCRGELSFARNQQSAETSPSASVKMEYRKALATTRRSERYETGNRDVFLFSLGNRCFRKGLPQEAVVQLVRQDFEEDDFDVAKPIRNAYTYTDKTTAAKEKKEDKPQTVRQIMDYLDAHYDIRRNTILDRLEYIVRDGKKGPQEYRPLRIKDYNSIFLSLQLAGINCFQNYLRAVIDSDYAREFNPFLAYFEALPPWDGTTDYIGQLADTVKTTDQEFWHVSFRRWLVGMVAGALRDEVVNQLVLILYSSQGKGKSSWIRHLLPPELKEYYRNGMLDPGNKDDLLLLTTRLLINMEEFEGARQGEVASLKRLIGQDVVTERKAYDLQADTFVRRASFIASTNSRQCLQDISGNRRFLLSVLTEIDYHAQVNYPGVYAQALALLNDGFRYWYEGDEIDELNHRNEQNRMKDPVEESLYVYYRPATSADFDAKWRPAAALLARLSIYGRMQVNRWAQQNLVQVLERDKFPTRVNDYGVTEYGVMEKEAVA